MIHPVRFPVPVWHAQFLSMLPRIRAYAAIAFRNRNPEAREEAVQEVVANALRAYVRLIELKKEAVAYPTVLARFGVAQVQEGRKVGGKLNVRDISSEYAQQRKRFHVERLDHFDDEENAWQEVLIEDKNAGPADVAATRIDFAAWLKQLPARTRRITKLLATGEKTSIVAKQFKVSAGRISQLRNELAQSWRVFQQEPEPSKLFRRVAASPAA